LRNTDLDDRQSPVCQPGY